MSQNRSTLTLKERGLSLIAAILLPSVLLAIALAFSVAVVRSGTALESMTSFDISRSTPSETPEPIEEKKPPEKKPSARPAKARNAVTVPPTMPVPELVQRDIPSEAANADPDAIVSPHETDGSGDGQGFLQASAGQETARVSNAAARGSMAGEPRAAADQYGARVYRTIKAQQRYSDAMRRRNLTGTVVIAFTINRRGRLGRQRVAQTSGVALLDRAALHQIRAAAPFPRPPEGRPRDFRMPLTYRPRD